MFHQIRILCNNERLWFQDEAIEAVKAGRAWGVLSISSNFSSALLDRMFNPLESDQRVRNQSKIMVSSSVFCLKKLAWR